MPKNKKNSKNNNNFKSKEKKEKNSLFYLPEQTKRLISGIFIFLIALIFILSFFGKAGAAGRFFMKVFYDLLLGKTIFVVPFILALAGLVFFITKNKRFIGPLILAVFILILGISGMLGTLKPEMKIGGLVGYYFSLPFLRLFETLVTQIIFGAAISVGILIFWLLLRQPESTEELKPAEEGGEVLEKKVPLLKKIFAPKFKVKEIDPEKAENKAKTRLPQALKGEAKPALKSRTMSYKSPPLELLEPDKEQPTSGDIKNNSAVIKKTLQNFNIPVEMSEINIGPTVTQYTFKPAEGIKLSKITTLSNDLALALASHPIRIEAPVPGRSLVGIEVPNKTRARVRFRDLVDNPSFQNSASSLLLVLGRDVAGLPVYADLAKMPHLLVAGSTGTGKTIFLNSLIMSLLYLNSPEVLRLILVDPKRVEFSGYNEIPHLLCPVIHGAVRTVNALKWLVSEMERRFEVLSEAQTRDIIGYNELAAKEGTPFLPYIVIIIDELADLMAAKGKEVEGGIVRLAQMARAVGIHLIVATQRPSVEVITGLIKANITARVTFQVASQIDSRTILDMAGAEKLLGLGDLLFISGEVAKPKRIQGPFVSDKEVKKVINYINTNNEDLKPEKLESEVLETSLSEDLERTFKESSSENSSGSYDQDPLFEEAKRTVIEAKKASASLLQRRLRIGYARAARLLDILEDKGVVGPSDGAKPREVFVSFNNENNHDNNQDNNNNNDGNEKSEDGWEKI